MAKQVCDISGSTGMSRGQSTEHLRNYKNIDPDAKKYGYYDPTRVGLNFEIVRGGLVRPLMKDYHIDMRVKDNMKARGIPDPKPIKMKDGNLKERTKIANIILGGSRDKMLYLAFGKQKVDLTKGADNSHLTRSRAIEDWAKDQYRLMCKLYGEDNIAAFVVHLDEKNPHVHCTVIPEVNGKISYNKMFGGNKDHARKKFLKLHDSIAEVNKKWGLDRGDDINVTHARHRTSEEYLHWLREECNEMEEKNETLEGKTIGLQQSINMLMDEIRHHERKKKALTTMVANDEKKLQQMAEEKRLLEEKIIEKNDSVIDAELTVDELEEKIRQLQEKVDDRQQEIDRTAELLRILKSQVEEKSDEIRNLDAKIDKMENQYKEYRDVRDTNLEKDIFYDFGRYIEANAKSIMDFLRNEIRPTLEMPERVKFDNFMNTTILPELADNSDELINTIGRMFLGEQGDETGLSTGGGGGSSPGGGWGRKKDEDDDAYRYRLIGSAAIHLRKAKYIGQKK